MRNTPRTDAQCYGDGRHPYVPTDFARQLERELAAVTKQRDRLAEAGQAVVDRWHTPIWKDVPHTAKFIQNLEDAVATAKGGSDE